MGLSFRFITLIFTILAFTNVVSAIACPTTYEKILERVSTEQIFRATREDTADELYFHNEGEPYPNGRQMNPVYLHENTRGRLFGGRDPVRLLVHYVNEVDRRNYQVQIQNQHILDHNGHPIDTTDGETSTVDFTTHVYIYVMDFNGNIYIAKGERLKFHHSSFFAGGPVAAAGEIAIRNGEIIMINDNSNHYQPTNINNQQVVSSLRRQGLTVPDSVQQFRSGQHF